MKKSIFLTVALSIATITNAQIAKTNIVEHFTNSNCSACAATNPGITATLVANPSVLHLTFYPSSPYANCFFSLQNAVENDARTNFYNIFGGTPRVVVNGANGSTASLSANITAANTTSSNFKISTTQQFVTADSVLVNITITKIAPDTSIAALLFVAAKQDTVMQTTGNGETVHRDVFRKSLSAITGNSITLPTAINDSTTYQFEYKIGINWQAFRMNTITILQNASKQVLQANQSINKIVQQVPTAIGTFSKSNNIIFPNPAKDEIQINSDTKIDVIKVYNQNGVLVLEQNFANDKINIKHLPSGIYSMQLIGKNNLETKLLQIMK